MTESPPSPGTVLSSTVPAKARIFDRHMLRRRRDRAAAQFDDHDFLIAEVAERLLDRLDDITHRFPLALDLGCRGGLLSELRGGRGGIETLLQADLSPAMLHQAHRKGPSLIADEEWLPFKPASLDLILSNLNLHWVNDLPGALLQIR